MSIHRRSWKMVLTKEFQQHLVQTARTLRGRDRRAFIARTVKALGPGGQRRAERELGWNRVTIRKAIHESDSGVCCYDAFAMRGRKRAEERLPTLLDDIKQIVDGQSQTDPKFKTQRLYTRLSAEVVRKQLLAQKGYTEKQLPSARTINRKLHQLGYHLKKVAKCKPKKRSAKQTRSLRD